MMIRWVYILNAGTAGSLPDQVQGTVADAGIAAPLYTAAVAGIATLHGNQG